MSVLSGTSGGGGGAGVTLFTRLLSGGRGLWRPHASLWFLETGEQHALIQSAGLSVSSGTRQADGHVSSVARTQAT